MNADRALRESYNEWRRLSEAEGDAICAGNWMLVFACQGALRRLQPLITHRKGEAWQEWARTGLNCQEKEKELSQIVTSLIELERRNRCLLETRRRAAQTELARLDEAGLALRRIQHSYAAAPAASPSSRI